MLSRQAILVLATSVLVVCLTSASSLPSSKRYPKVAIGGDPASDQALKNVSDRLNKLVDFGADPCDDFYEFACGQEKQQESEWSMSEYMTIEVAFRKNYLIRDPKVYMTTEQVLLRSLFHSCISFEATKDANFGTIRHLVRELGGIPALGERSGWTDDKASQTSWTHLIVQLRRVGLSMTTIFTLQVYIDLEGTKNVIYLTPAIIQQKEANFSWEDHYMSQISKYLLPDMTETEIVKLKEHLKLVVAFRQKLSNTLNGNDLEYSKQSKNAFNASMPTIDLSLGDAAISEYQQMTIKDLELLVPRIAWTSFISDLLQRPVSKETGIYVNQTKVIVAIQKLVDETDRLVLRDFIMVDAITEWFADYKDFNGAACLKRVEDNLGLELTAEYVRNYLLPETRASAIVMTDYLRRELKTMIDEADWIWPMAKQGALAKVDSMISYVGYPDELFDEKEMANYHSGLELTPTNFTANMLSISRWVDRIRSRSLGQPNKESGWREFDTGSLEMNSEYVSKYNSIDILPTMIQGFLFNSRQPNYVNFAALGFIVGHEISHAFDSDCVKYDCQGQDHCWWDLKTGAEYQARSKCFLDQYDQTTVFGNYSWLDGSFTLGENIADNIGAKLAHRAYQKWLADQPAGFEEPRLTDGQLANYNQDQLFWTSFAQYMCIEKEHDEKDDHSPNKLRVDVTLSNQVDFAKAFQCPLGSRMNPSNKCALW